MLEFCFARNNGWTPPVLKTENWLYQLPQGLGPEGEYLLIMQTEPYIDAIYVRYTAYTSMERSFTKRFVFREDYIWSDEDEQFFADHLLENTGLRFSPLVDEIFRYYSEKFPDWKLKRYYTKPMRLLDHIYHCMRKGSAKEMLYKSGLDELAVHIGEMDEVNLLASRPSELYEGISMRTLRSMNCREGARVLSTATKRSFVKKLQKAAPNLFREKMNDAQCRYLDFLIDGDLTVDEAGRLLSARYNALRMLWAPSLYEMFIWKEQKNRELQQNMEQLSQIDPIYREYIRKRDPQDNSPEGQKLSYLIYYLLVAREKHDKMIKRSNRKRNATWQEKSQEYVVRYPQTINDFCREAVYMSNCLLTYVDAYVENATTILFVRKSEDANTPFITMEVYGNELMQAYHRFNEPCTLEEIKWIMAYCDRHGIEHWKI